MRLLRGLREDKNELTMGFSRAAGYKGMRSMCSHGMRKVERLLSVPTSYVMLFEDFFGVRATPLVY
jgi:hypothetical protein